MVVEEALYDYPVAQLVEESNEDRFTNPWSQYFAIMDYNWDYDFDLDMHEPND